MKEYSVCPICHIKSLCLSSHLKKAELIALNKIINKPVTVERNTKLFNDGEAFSALYIVNSGIFKSFIISDSGSEKILNFHLPGEVFGLDGIHSEHYQSTVTSIHMSSYNKISYNDLLEFSHDTPQVQQNLLKILSREIYSCKRNHVDLNGKAKLALFIKNISQRFEIRGYSGKEFNLPLSQRDIANYLGMAEETLSRIFKKIQALGAIKYKKHTLTILDYDLLHSLSET